MWTTASRYLKVVALLGAIFVLGLLAPIVLLPVMLMDRLRGKSRGHVWRDPE